MKQQVCPLPLRAFQCDVPVTYCYDSDVMFAEHRCTCVAVFLVTSSPYGLKLLVREQSIDCSAVASAA